MERHATKTTFYISRFTNVYVEYIYILIEYIYILIAIATYIYIMKKNKMLRCKTWIL